MENCVVQHLHIYISLPDAHKVLYSDMNPVKIQNKDSHPPPKFNTVKHKAMIYMDVI